MIREFILGALGAFGGTMGFAIWVNAPRRTVLPTSTTSMAGYLVYLLLFRLMGRGVLVSYFLATVVISVICEAEARMMRMPATVFLLCALVPLVPGYSFYSAMLALVENNGALAAASMMQAVQIVAAIAVGAAASSTCVRSATELRKKRRAKS